MNPAQSVFSWLSLYLVGTCFFLTASVYALTNVFSPANIKQTTGELDTYSKIVPAVLSTAQYNGPEAAGQLPLREPWVQEAANKAFSSADLQQKGDTVVDSTFTWLDGQTNKPEFSLDFTANKDRLAQELAGYTENRLNGLPACSLSNIPKSLDAYKIDCLPFGVNPGSVADSIRSDVAGSQNFLKNPVVSVDSIEGALGAGTQNPFSQLQGGGWFYQNRGLLLWILPILTVLFAVAGIALARDRQTGLRRLSRSFFGASISLVLFAIILSLGFELIINASARDAISKDVIGPVLVDLAEQARVVYLVFAGIALVLSGVFWVVRRRLFSQKI